MHQLPLRRLFIGGILALLCAQLLYGTLMLSALYKQYQEPVFQINGLICQDIADHLGFLVRVGKSLRPQTLERFLSQYHTRTEAENIAVTDTKGNVIHQWAKNGPLSLVTPPDAKTVFGQVQKFSTSDNFWTTCVITGRNGVAAGHVFLALDKKRISSLLADAAKGQLLLFFGVTAGECLLLALLLKFFAFPRMHATPKNFSLRLRACFMLPLVAGQIFILCMLYSPLSRLYDEEMTHTGTQLARQITWDLERLSGMGLPVSGIQGMEDWMTARQKHVSTLGMAVFDVTGRLHAAADAQGKLSESDWQKICATAAPVKLEMRHPADGTPIGSVEVVMNPATAGSNLRSVMLDNLTMTVVAALFLSELLFLLLMSRKGTAAMSRSPEFMRPIIFACLFATEMSMSYVPIRIGELGLDLFGLPPDLVSGLPVSCELFMAGLAMFAGGFWSQKSGWKPMLLSGLALACLGSCASWLSPSALPFILARGMSGLGYGFINLSAQVFVIAHSSEDNRARNLAFMFAGLYAGTLCGSTMGGLHCRQTGLPRRISCFRRHACRYRCGSFPFAAPRSLAKRGRHVLPTQPSGSAGFSSRQAHGSAHALLHHTQCPHYGMPVPVLHAAFAEPGRNLAGNHRPRLSFVLRHRHVCGACFRLSARQGKAHGTPSFSFHAHCLAQRDGPARV